MIKFIEGSVGRRGTRLDVDALEPGDCVAVLERGSRGRSEGVITLTVERKTPTQVVLRSGRAEWRFRRADGREIGGRGSVYTVLRAISDPAVVAVLQRESLAKLGGRITTILSGSMTTHEERIEALNRITRATANTEAYIQGLEATIDPAHAAG